MAAPQTPKQVGVGGCLVSILVFVLSGVAFIGLVIWAGVSVVNELQSAPGVDLGESGQVTISNTGPQIVFLGNFVSGQSIPLADPDVTITDPSGKPVRVSKSSTTSSGSSSGGSFRSIGEFTAVTTGTYTVSSSGVSTTSSTAGTKVYVTNVDLNSLGVRVLLAVGVGGLLFVLSIVLAIVWLVRRSKSKRANRPPPYQGGYPAAPPGGYGSGYPPAAYPGGTPGGYPPAPGPAYPPAAGPGGPPTGPPVA